MATVNFLYRSIKNKAPLTLRLLYRYENKDYQIDAKTKNQVPKDYWEKTHFAKRVNDPDLSNYRTDVIKQLDALRSFVLTQFNDSLTHEVNKKWLKDIVKAYYSPKKQKVIPVDLIGFIDYYLKVKDVSETQSKKMITIKNKMTRFQDELEREFLIADINEDFKNKFTTYYNKYQYAQNTQQREFTLIKTVCRYARYLGLYTHHQLDEMRIKREEIEHIYLTFNELEKLKIYQFDKDYLNNARDWLIISCYTGQRVSDFMRFTSEMIREEDGKRLLEFKQKKTQKFMTIPLLKEVDEVLNRRGGKFPRAISAQKYNDYIKEVCEACGIDEMSKGKVRQCIYPDKPKSERKPEDYRDVSGTFPKHKLVTSHIGRRSFATNYYGKVPTTFLKEITGHSTEKMFLNYIKKSNKDLALDALKYFEQ